MPYPISIAKHVLLASSALAISGMASTASAQSQEPITVVADAPAQDNDPYVASAAAMRLERVGFQISSANGDKCEKPEMLSGLVVHDVSDYDAGMRQEIIRKSHLTYGFGVLGIVAGSPAEAAGLKIADEIIGVNGASLQDAAFASLPSRASYARIENFNTMLSGAMALGPVQLEVLRNGRTITLSITGVAGCGGRMSLQPSKQLNAWSDGRYVAVTERMMSFVKNDNELAFVVAHEMAHNIKNHATELKARSALLASFGFGASKFYKTEVEADSFAISLLSATNFDLAGSTQLFSHFGSFSLLYLSPTHPTFGRRMAIVTEAIGRISKPEPQLAAISLDAGSFSLSAVQTAKCYLDGRFAFAGWKCLDGFDTSKPAAPDQLGSSRPLTNFSKGSYALSVSLNSNSHASLLLPTKEKPAATIATGSITYPPLASLNRGLMWQ